VLDGEPAKRREARDEALGEDVAQRLAIERLVEPQDRVDDHPVRWAVHVQPRRVGVGHRPAGHRGALMRRGGRR
jgi:hypothetical protein